MNLDRLILREDRNRRQIQYLAKELLDIQGGSVADALNMVEPGYFTEEEENELVNYVEQLGLPHPYLTRAETNERLMVLGFEFKEDGTLKDSQEGRKKFTAILELISGAIAEWADVKDDMRIPGTEPEPGSPWAEAGLEGQTPGEMVNELMEWGEEWLVG